MTKRILGITIAIIAMIAIIASTAKAAETWYVGCDGLNLRTAATTDSDIIAVYPHGTPIEIIGIDSSGEWWESGKRNPSYRTIRTICERFNVSADWLMGYSEEMYRK